MDAWKRRMRAAAALAEEDRARRLAQRKENEKREREAAAAAAAALAEEEEERARLLAERKENEKREREAAAAAEEGLKQIRLRLHRISAQQKVQDEVDEMHREKKRHAERSDDMLLGAKKRANLASSPSRSPSRSPRRTRRRTGRRSARNMTRGKKQITRRDPPVPEIHVHAFRGQEAATKQKRQEEEEEERRLRLENVTKRRQETANGLVKMGHAALARQKLKIVADQAAIEGIIRDQRKMKEADAEKARQAEAEKVQRAESLRWAESVRLAAERRAESVRRAAERRAEEEAVRRAEKEAEKDHVILDTDDGTYSEGFPADLTAKGTVTGSVEEEAKALRAWNFIVKKAITILLGNSITSEASGLIAIKRELTPDLAKYHDQYVALSIPDWVKHTGPNETWNFARAAAFPPPPPPTTDEWNNVVWARYRVAYYPDAGAIAAYNAAARKYRNSHSSLEDDEYVLQLENALKALVAKQREKTGGHCRRISRRRPITRRR